MPRATVQTETTRRELVNCPGGFVELKQLSFYDMLFRRDHAMQVNMRDAANGKPSEMGLQFSNAWVRQFEFSKCIADHNLEDEFGNKLNFQNPDTLKQLDPRIASEIERYIDELNQDLTEESLEDFTEPSASLSTDELHEPNDSSAGTQ